MKKSDSLRVGLVSMPWGQYSMPSIQLAVLAAALQQHGIASESHELYLDYAAHIGLTLYQFLGAKDLSKGSVAEWLFAQHYFGPETGDWLAEFRARRPRRVPDLFGLSLDISEERLDEVVSATGDFLKEAAGGTDWSRYCVIGFTISAHQLAPSMALARLIKKRHPGVAIVFGGASCAGPMGPAILRVCPYVDVVVRVEGEPVFPELVRRIAGQQGYDGIPGISWREAGGEVVDSPPGELYTAHGERPPLHYDAYFERLERLGLQDRVEAWLPFESSRGCWYGEKVQCTFCGLHDIMRYRVWEPEHVLDELEDWAERYGITRFFAVDLNMPPLSETPLPEIIRRGHRWRLFYETKSNLTRPEVEMLAEAGVRWIQPGIESLDMEPLRLMRKGVSPLQNIQLLKWCKELGIKAVWNLLFGFPGESPEVYARLAERMRLLFHLSAPVRAGSWHLARFSPYFEQPETFGIEYLGTHPLYQYIFPVPEDVLNDLVYLHDYAIADDVPREACAIPVKEVHREWLLARVQRATLEFHMAADGAAEIRDTRYGTATTYDLTPAQAVLYLFLDAATTERTLADRFGQAYPGEAQTLARQDGGVEQVVRRWKQQKLVISDHGRVLALAINGPEVAAFREKLTPPADLHTEV
jgi:ribosomal peptide maturation radical SAM protein 1